MAENRGTSFTSIGATVTSIAKTNMFGSKSVPEMNAPATDRHVHKLAPKAARMFGSTPT